MPDDKIQYLSQEKRESLKQELLKLKEVTIPEIAKRIDEAKQMGDLSENAEYHQAREDMSWVQSRVNEINYILDNSEEITSVSGAKVVQVGCSIKVKINGVVKEYMIVGPQEANPIVGKISNESPLGQAFLGRKEGDKVEIKVPAGSQIYKITEIYNFSQFTLLTGGFFVLTFSTFI
jgi:transcription elongation factor GreA